MRPCYPLGDGADREILGIEVQQTYTTHDHRAMETTTVSSNSYISVCRESISVLPFRS